MPNEVILYGPESLPYALAGDIGNKSNNVAATLAVAGVTGMPKGIYPLGTQLVLRDGRKFRYASVCATTLVVGTLVQGSISLTTDTGMSAIASTTVNPYTGAIADNSKGSPALAFTHGAATVIANFFAEGYIYVNVTPGGGDYYKIAAHPAFANGANTPADLVNLWPGHKLRNALTDTTSKVSLLSHPNSRVVRVPSTLPTAQIAGVAITPLTGAAGRGNFGWLQTRGAVPILMDNTTGVVGQPAIASTVTGGAVSLITTTNIITSPIVGNFMFIGASAAFSLVYLTIDG